MNNLDAYIAKLTQSPDTLTFEETITQIDAMYDFVETAFQNGDIENAAGENSGSCKVLSFAIKHELDEHQTLNMFAQYYRKDVLGNLMGDDHQNIRQFMRHGFDKLAFAGEALQEKTV